MKVGLITYYGDNYGGCLQAYALLESATKLGHDVSILPVVIEAPHHPSVWKRRLSFLFKNPFKIINRRKYTRQFVHLNDTLRHKSFEQFRSRFLKFDSSLLIDHNSSGVELIERGYHAVVCGSDQIWNPNLYGVHPIWFLKFVPQKIRKIAYAPSLGVSKINPEFNKEIKDSLADFKYISTREQEGADIISSIINEPVDVVLDPTLLLTETEWRGMSSPLDIKEPYILCYLFGDADYFSIVKDKVKELTGYKIISLPYNLRELKSDDELLYDVSPAEFVWLIDNASLVVTDSFHATAFSVNLESPFISLLRFNDDDSRSMNSRLYTILKKVGLTSRLVRPNDVDKLDKTYLFNIDFKEAKLKLRQYSCVDLHKLAKAIDE